MNELVERFNKMLFELLAKLEEKDWDKKIASVLFVIEIKTKFDFYKKGSKVTI